MVVCAEYDVCGSVLRTYLGNQVAKWTVGETVILNLRIQHHIS